MRTALTFEGLVATLLSDPNPVIRRRAALKLGDVATPHGVAGLRAALGDEHSDVRRAASVALVRLHDAKTVARTLKAVGSEDTDLAIEAAQVLGRSRYQPGVPRLLEVFRGAKSMVAAAVADALGEIGDPIAAPLLCLALENRFVAPAAANALGRIGDERALPPLLRALENSEHAELRSSAARALGLIRKRDKRRLAKQETLVFSRVVPALRVALKDDDRPVRVNAAVALWDLGDRSLSPRLIREIEEMTTQLVGPQAIHMSMAIRGEENTAPG